jgi:peroxiredoxin
MNRKVLTAYGILKMYDLKNEKYNWARRTTIIVDKEGRIQHIEFDNSAVDPATAIAVCTKMQKKDGQK